MLIQALIFDGFDELDYFGVFEALRMGGFAVSCRTLHEQDIVTAAYGTRVAPDAQFSIFEKPDLLIVVGGGWLAQSPKGAWAEVQEGTILRVAKECYDQGVVLATVCTGALVLGHAGLLTGRRATTNQGAVQELKQLGAKYVEQRVVDDGDIITAGGITSSLDLGIHLLERFASHQHAREVSSKLEYTRTYKWQSA